MNEQNRADAGKDCPNYNENLETCPCESEDCPRRGFCCRCLAHHREKNSKTACMR
jgi:hypothetical protein